MSNDHRLREEAQQIWAAGVAAVRADRAVQRHLLITPRGFQLAGQRYDWQHVGRLIVVGAGKAGAAMASGVEQALAAAPANRITGWINVPEGPGWATRWIQLHSARPLGRNEPTHSAVAGTDQILQLVRHADPQDICLCLISGGASALLVRPAEGISLAQKQSLAQRLSAAGATIGELNLVRTQMSEVKGGGLARACRADTLLTMVLSDVLGDPLEVIGSGPTVQRAPACAEACRVLERYHVERRLPDLYAWLQARASTGTPDSFRDREAKDGPPRHVRHVLVGTLAMAMQAAAERARQLGYEVVTVPPRQPPLTAEREALELADEFAAMCQRHKKTCFVSGGEPVVELVDASRRGHGGRNQQLVLAAGWRLSQSPSWCSGADRPRRWVFLSGGTDGEDGSTTAAGAWWSDESGDRAMQLGLQPPDFLHRNDAYSFFRAIDGLFITGPTGTNVCDLRVAVCDDAAD